MIFVLNKGASKTVRLKSGVTRTIPSGATSLPSDENLLKAVNSNRELERITQEAFFELNKKVPMKQKVQEATAKRKEEIDNAAQEAKKSKEGDGTVGNSKEQSGKKPKQSKKSAEKKTPDKPKEE